MNIQVLKETTPAVQDPGQPTLFETPKELDEALERELSEVAIGLLERLTVESTFNTNYVIMTTMASIVSAAGFCTNNPVIIVASMLISPLMGPILGFTFGSYIRDWRLVSIAIHCEAGGIVVCLVVGFLFGLGVAPWASDLGVPNPEMLGRASYVNLIFGVIIALPSGVAVAISILFENVSSLVGVAISASLLPPVVVSGMFMAFSFLRAVLPSLLFQANLSALEFFVYACISLALFVINFVCISLAAYIMFIINARIIHKGNNLENQVYKQAQDYANSLNIYSKETKAMAEYAKSLAAKETDASSQLESNPQTPLFAPQRSEPDAIPLSELFRPPKSEAQSQSTDIDIPPQLPTIRLRGHQNPEAIRLRPHSVHDAFDLKKRMSGFRDL